MSSSNAETAPSRSFCFDASQRHVAEQLCEAIVPGSSPAGPAVYLDSVAADMPDEQRAALLGCLDDVGTVLGTGGSWEDVAARDHFGWLRALCIEAYYSDFRQPGYTGPGAWSVIGFTSAPMAAMAKQDWSYLRCFREEGE
ncbi:hypothetical protein EF847_22210 [Actinobacteria bacterium YIM 96077]|uniref:Gluconate 2-dehydrogenase subunit 3 family protein n=1 Tax=Phytoactinopolyspora halophila TaxID=1981511 RepID=A0A329QXV4_9ACTN|nr:hypothetical protein [Phytoactinopolyspora halophila]AYY15001.1 hypothetical protein EF847_22210 [Actinobacteria bacterium YIM 96077]RAW15458.1 hypothetical protein DPM12_09440 [Phytoactinopolyspora halophila]